MRRIQQVLINLKLLLDYNNKLRQYQHAKGSEQTTTACARGYPV